jgi:hypothetical protein
MPKRYLPGGDRRQARLRAFAVDFTNPCCAHGWGKGPKLGGSQNEALRSCYKDGGKECVIRTFFCDAKG